MTEKKAKRYIFGLAAATCVIAAIFLSVLYMLDPFQVLHRSYFAPDKFIRDAGRFQSAGIINRLSERADCCDTVIIGTSHSQNFLPSDVEKIMGAHGVLQLSLPGGIPSEQKILLERALATGKIKKVIMDIHIRYDEDKIVPVNDPATLSRDPGKFFPEDLYDNVKWNDFFHLASIDIAAKFIEQVRNGEPYEEHMSWHKESLHAYGHAEELVKNNPGAGEKTSPEDYASYKFPNIHDLLIPLIKAHPDQEFYLFIPPYSRHYYATLKNDEFQSLMAMRATLVREIAKLPNAKLFVFDDIFDAPDDLNRYRDLMHFDEDVSRDILRAMAANQNTLKARDIDAHIKRITQLVNDYARKIRKK